MPPADTHDQQASSSSAIPKERRFKLSRACDRCRRRRIKCDEGHPCQACLTAASACTFEELGKRTHPHKSKRTATLEDRMHHLEKLIQAIPSAVFAAGAVTPGHTMPSDSPTTSSLVPSMFPDTARSGVPPPSLHVFPLTNPSTHFTYDAKVDERRSRRNSLNPLSGGSYFLSSSKNPDYCSDDTCSKASLTASYLYFDDEGYTRWQGETSGLPLLDLLAERHTPVVVANAEQRNNHLDSPTGLEGGAANTDWFPNRQPRRSDVDPQTFWRLITSYIAPKFMDSLVQCYLSTSYYMLPFIHVPTFLADYGNPKMWGEPGFAAFIVSVCCLASRHMDDPRVRADPASPISAGTQWFELLNRIRSLPIADRPTLYNIQASLVAAVYAVGLGKLSKTAALLAEAVTMSIDAGLHRSADNYDLFDPIEDEVRKRTFWCVYIWDKQFGAHFGRPSLLRLRDCDVAEPSPVDDEFITREGVGVPPPGTECRLSAFVLSLRIMVVLEAVLDVPPGRQLDDSSPFLLRASHVLSGGRRFKEMRDEEFLLDEIHRKIPAYWAHSPEVMNGEDTIRLTQSARLHCAEHFVRLLIYRHRFSELVAERTSGAVEEEQTELEKEALVSAHNSALQIISAHVHIAKRGLMTYYGVHVIHQLTQTGRTLVAILLCCKTDDLQHLIPSALDGLRSCIGLLRRFSNRYVCGLRSGDLMEEFCRLTNIPVETPGQDEPSRASRPPWIRPVRKKAPSLARSNHSGGGGGGDSPPHHSSPEAFSPSDFFVAEPPNSSVFPSTPSSASGSCSQPSTTTSPPQYVNNGTTNGGCVGHSQTQTTTNNSTYMDTSGDNNNNNMGIIMDPQMYMFPGEMMALFNDGAVDVCQLFPSVEFMQQQQQPSAMNHQNNDRQSIGGGSVGVGVGEGGGPVTGFASNPTFLKRDGIVNS